MSATWSFHPYALPLARPYSWAKGIQTERLGLLVACQEDGTVGWGEVAPPPHLQVDGARIASFARKSLRVPLAQEDVPAALDAANCGPRLRSGLAGAWLDLQARKAGQTLAAYVARRLRLDATPAAGVPVNGLVTAQPPDACARDAAALVDLGFGTLKVKSDGNPARDVERLRAVRKAVGDAVRLRLDANESYAPETARRHLEELAPFGLEYVEQPIPSTRRDELVRLLQDPPVPVALDEAASSWQAVAPLAHLRPIPILKPQRLGGIDRTAHFIAKASAAGLRCVVTNSIETAVGRAHALHSASLLPQPLPACGLATAGFLSRDVADLPGPRQGWMDLPAGPGLGVGMEAPLAAALE